jgi:hypothetical protein
MTILGTLFYLFYTCHINLLFPKGLCENIEYTYVHVKNGMFFTFIIYFYEFFIISSYACRSQNTIPPLNPEMFKKNVGITL